MKKFFVFLYISSNMSEPQRKMQTISAHPQSKGAHSQAPLGVVSTHPAAQAVAPFTGDFPLALFRQQPSSAARTGAQHAPHLQYTLLCAILLVPVVLGKVEGKVSCACDPEQPKVSCFCLSAQMRNSDCVLNWVQ